MSDKEKKSTVRIMLSIHPDLLKKVDELAERMYTSRSNVVRMALMHILDQSGGE